MNLRTHEFSTFSMSNSLVKKMMEGAGDAGSFLMTGAAVAGDADRGFFALSGEAAAAAEVVEEGGGGCDEVVVAAEVGYLDILCTMLDFLK